MILALDVGNSVTKAALFDNSDVVETCKFNGADIPESLLKIKNLAGCAISSVVPASGDKIFEIISATYGIEPYIVKRTSRMNISIDYETPQTLGIDRICGSCGALTLFHSLKRNTGYSKNDIIITVDFGTATTINVIKYKARFSGGIIAPGITTMINSLKEKTAMLPAVGIEDYDDIVGKSTKKSIASGIINSTTGLLEKLVTTLGEGKNAPEFHIYITGGNAEHIAPFISFKHHHAPDLVMRGIKKIYELNLE